MKEMKALSILQTIIAVFSLLWTSFMLIRSMVNDVHVFNVVVFSIMVILSALFVALSIKELREY